MAEFGGGVPESQAWSVVCEQDRIYLCKFEVTDWNSNFCFLCSFFQGHSSKPFKFKLYTIITYIYIYNYTEWLFSEI